MSLWLWASKAHSHASVVYNMRHRFQCLNDFCQLVYWAQGEQVLEDEESYICPSCGHTSLPYVPPSLRYLQEDNKEDDEQDII